MTHPLLQMNITAHYYGVRNETVIDKNTGTGGTTETLPGLRIVKLITNKGGVRVAY